MSWMGQMFSVTPEIKLKHKTAAELEVLKAIEMKYSKVGKLEVKIQTHIGPEM